MGSCRGGGGVGREEPPRPLRVSGSSRRGSGGHEPARGALVPFCLSLRSVAWRSGSVSAHFWGEASSPPSPGGFEPVKAGVCRCPPSHRKACRRLGLQPGGVLAEPSRTPVPPARPGICEKVLTGGGSADCGSPTCPRLPDVPDALEAGVRGPGAPCLDLEHPGLGFCFVWPVALSRQGDFTQKLQRQHFIPFYSAAPL